MDYVMNSMRRVVMWALLASIAAHAVMLAETTAELIQKVERHYNGARTLSVDFVEGYSLQGHRRPAEAGKLTLRKRGKMRWDYSQPAGKVFISDGKMVYLYTSADNRVEKIPLRDTEDMKAPLAFLLGNLDLRKEFQGFTQRPVGNEVWLGAGAKNTKTPYDQIEMRIEPAGEISRLQVMGRDGSRLEFELSHEQVNPAVSDSLFNFKIPAGAEVVDAVEYAGEGR